MKKLVIIFALLVFVHVSAKAQKRGSKSHSSGSTKSTSSRNYSGGGTIRVQKGYTKANGTYVAPHLKTKPDGIKSNNLRGK